MSPNKITGANAGGQRLFRFSTTRAARRSVFSFGNMRTKPARSMTIVIPPDAVRVLKGGDRIIDPGVWYGSIGKEQYESTISRAAILDGPTWMSSRPFPSSYVLAVRRARTVLAKLVPTYRDWQLSEISLQRLQDAEPQRWFFMLCFSRETGRAPSHGVLQIPVTFHGIVGTVKKVRAK